MKILLTRLFAFSLLVFIGELNCMKKSNCKTTVSNNQYVGKVTTTNCKERNGGSSTKTTFSDGSSLKIQTTPPSKKK